MIELMKDDLAKSGLNPTDINARPATAAEFAACNINNPVAQGYVIPYYSITGAPLGFYRLRLLGQPAGANVYRQPPNTNNHLYFPPQFLPCLEALIIRCSKTKERPFVIITEGEKKAAKACKDGFPTVAVSGVDSWRNRTITLPSDAETFKTGQDGDERIKVKLPTMGVEDLIEKGAVAQGFNNLVELVMNNELAVFICYDSDPVASVSILGSIAERAALEAATGTIEEGDYDTAATAELEEAELNPALLRQTHLKFEVQRAAATLGYELRSRGIPTRSIRQLILPLPDTIDEEPKKVGLDDFLVANTPDDLNILIVENFGKRTAFPRHPAIKSFIVTQLQKQMGRKQFQQLALAIITELDARGRRLMDVNTKAPFYFDDELHKLFPVRLSGKEPIHETPFGQFLYASFGVAGADWRLIEWLASQFTGEQPIELVEPKKVYAFVTRPSDDPKFPSIAVQLSDSEYAIVGASTSVPIEIVFNGTYGVLFEPGHVEPVRKQDLLTAFYEQSRTFQRKVLPNWWQRVLCELSVKDPAGVPRGSSINHHALLYYISPFLLRWKDMQLPIEFAIGEAGSGKSSLYALRMYILTGIPSLRNMPRDIRDFYSGIVSCGGVYAVDNAKFTDRQIQQALSDDMCRITTEPDPHIELRKLYTTSDLFRAPIRSTFLWTAIEMPFRTVDLIQRSSILHLNAIAGQKDGDWVRKRLAEHNGRVNWLAHHLLFLHRFLGLAKQRWNPDYAARHRLAHYEQSLHIAAEVFGMETEFLKPTLKASMEKVIEDSDWAMNGLQEFAQHMRAQYKPGVSFPVSAIVEWVATQDEYCDNDILKNPRLLGRYLQAHSQSVASLTGIREAGTYGNKRVYKLVQLDIREPSEVPTGMESDEAAASEATKH